MKWLVSLFSPHHCDVDFGLPTCPTGAEKPPLKNAIPLIPSPASGPPTPAWAAAARGLPLALRHRQPAYRCLTLREAQRHPYSPHPTDPAADYFDHPETLVAFTSAKAALLDGRGWQRGVLLVIHPADAFDPDCCPVAFAALLPLCHSRLAVYPPRQRLCVTASRYWTWQEVESTLQVDLLPAVQGEIVFVIEMEAWPPLSSATPPPPLEATAGVLSLLAEEFRLRALPARLPLVMPRRERSAALSSSRRASARPLSARRPRRGSTASTPPPASPAPVPPAGAAREEGMPTTEGHVLVNPVAGETVPPTAGDIDRWIEEAEAARCAGDALAAARLYEAARRALPPAPGSFEAAVARRRVDAGLRRAYHEAAAAHPAGSQCCCCVLQ